MSTCIIGHGIDLVPIDRIEQLLERHGERFLSRVFTDAEYKYAQASKKRMAEHLAGRFAVKEAILKAMGTGWTNGIAWTEMEVVRMDRGQPHARLTGRCLELATERGITSWHISISHTETHATASAIAVGEPQPAKNIS